MHTYIHTNTYKYIQYTYLYIYIHTLAFIHTHCNILRYIHSLPYITYEGFFRRTVADSDRWLLPIHRRPHPPVHASAAVSVLAGGHVCGVSLPQDPAHDRQVREPDLARCQDHPILATRRFLIFILGIFFIIQCGNKEFINFRYQISLSHVYVLQALMRKWRTWL